MQQEQEDQIIVEAEQEFSEKGNTIDARAALKELRRRYLKQEN